MRTGTKMAVPPNFHCCRCYFGHSSSHFPHRERRLARATTTRNRIEIPSSVIVQPSSLNLTFSLFLMLFQFFLLHFHHDFSLPLQCVFKWPISLYEVTFTTGVTARIAAANTIARSAHLAQSATEEMKKQRRWPPQNARKRLLTGQRHILALF